MEPKDYKHWKWLQEVEQAGGDIDAANAKRKVPSEEEVLLSDAIFEAISKRAWTDVLLQVCLCNSVGTCFVYKVM